MLCKQDYWLSLDRYINWSSTAKSTNDFYTDWQCRQAYKDHIEHYVNRRNTYNGRLYKEDPTIFYWDLINEPRWCVLSRCGAFLCNSSCSILGMAPGLLGFCCSASRSNGCQWKFFLGSLECCSHNDSAGQCKVQLQQICGMWSRDMWSICG